ncbi:hypothetical protein LTR53_013569 [Teratosphaeriaceae sp. CCFEE 6253]|nr:hypothetical protein LTR53_013569 [Teratosphaeriaceae sp. CCFEE 6253]
MHPQQALAILALASLAACQTPPGMQPAADQSLRASWNGQYLAVNQLLPNSILRTPPDLSPNHTLPNATYMVAMDDVSAPLSWLAGNLSATEIARGLTPNRTTWLQWLQSDFTQAADGKFSSSAAPLAEYGYPNPPAGDGEHTYILYLFPQLGSLDSPDFAAANGSLPGLDAGREILATDASGRLNWNLGNLEAGAGFPVAATYFRVSADGATSTTGAGSESSGTNVTGLKPGVSATSAGSGVTAAQAGTNGAGAVGSRFGVAVLMGMVTLVGMLV